MGIKDSDLSSTIADGPMIRPFATPQERWVTTPVDNADGTEEVGFNGTKASDMQVGGQHYVGMEIQPSEFIYKNDLNWLQGNAIKYICRHHLKG